MSNEVTEYINATFYIISLKTIQGNIVIVEPKSKVYTDKSNYFTHSKFCLTGNEKFKRIPTTIHFKN